MAPATAREHGLETGQIVELRVGGQAVAIPAWVQPGHPEGAITVSLGALGLLLALTVALAYVPLGIGNVVASLAIATTKAALVMLVFMKLWRGRPLNQLAAGILAVWLAVLIGLTFADYLTRPRIGESDATDLPAPRPARPTP